MRWMPSRISAALTPKRRWLRFSLKTFLLIITVFCVWLGMQANRVREQKRAIAMIHRLGGKFHYDYWHDAMVQPDTLRRVWLASPESGPPIDIEPPGPAWLRRLIGDEYFINLHGVTFIDTPATDADLELLKNQDDLFCLRLWETQITDEGLRHIRRLRNLRILDLRNAQITDVGLVHVGNLKNLAGLGLGSTQVTDAGLEHIEGLTGLGSLTLSHTNIGDDGIAHLSGLTELRSLNLDGTQITDSGLVHLAGLLKLKQLQLNDTVITDAGLVHLQNLSNLWFWNLNDTYVTEDAVQGLFRTLPNITEIRRTPVRRTR